MARELNLVKMGPVGGDSYRLYSLRPEGIIAGALETTTLPVRTFGMAMGTAGQALTLDLTVPTEPALKFATVGGGTYVSLQATSPGTADTGNANISGQFISGYAASVVSAGAVAAINALSATSGIAIRAAATSGYGILSEATTGYGVKAVSSGAASIGVWGEGGAGMSGFFQSNNGVNNTVSTLVSRQYGSATADLFQAQAYSGAAMVAAVSCVGRGTFTGERLAQVTKAVDYTLTLADRSCWVNASGANRTITLPTAVGLSGYGAIYVIKKTDSSANTVTIATTSSQTIDGAATKVLTTQYEYVMVQSDNENWHII